LLGKRGGIRQGDEITPEPCDKQVTIFLVAITLRFPINCASFRHLIFLRELSF
jgi:hypothetical protein